MASARRIFSLWNDLIPSVWIGVYSLARAVVQSPNSLFLETALISAGSSLLLAYLLLRRYPDIQSRRVWGFNGIVIAVFVAGNVVVSNGIYASQGDGSPLVIGALWIVSLTIAYGVVYAGGYSWAKRQLFARKED
jgi:predicted permease